MTKKPLIPTAAALAVVLPALAWTAVRDDLRRPFTPNRSFVYVFFDPAQPVGTTVANTCLRFVRSPSPVPNIEFEKVFRADLDRIALSLRIREIEIVGFSCPSDAALITWAPSSRHLSSRLESALKALPYVQFLALGLAGEPDAQAALRPVAAHDRGASEGVESPERPLSWGAIKILYR